MLNSNVHSGSLQWYFGLKWAILRNYEKRKNFHKVNYQSDPVYEQRTRNINHAQGDILNRLANALDCAIEDLLEDDPASRA